MNTQLKNYLDLQNKFNRIEQLTNSAWDVHYCYDKIVPTLWGDGFDFGDIVDYMTMQLQLYIDKMEKAEEPNLPTLKE